MKTNNRTITKREVINLFKKISKEVVNMKTGEDICEYIHSLIPDAEELGSETFENDIDDDFVVDFIIPRKYTGNHTKDEFLEVDEHFRYLLSFGTVTFYIYKKRKNSFEVFAYAGFEYNGVSCGEYYDDLLIKSQIVKIPLEYEKSKI